MESRNRLNENCYLPLNGLIRENHVARVGGKDVAVSCGNIVTALLQSIGVPFTKKFMRPFIGPCWNDGYWNMLRRTPVTKAFRRGTTVSRDQDTRSRQSYLSLFAMDGYLCMIKHEHFSVACLHLSLMRWSNTGQRCYSSAMALSANSLYLLGSNLSRLQPLALPSRMRSCFSSIFISSALDDQ